MSQEFGPVSYLISGDILKKDFIKLCQIAEDEDANICIVDPLKESPEDIQYSHSGHAKLLNLNNADHGYLPTTRKITNKNNTLLCIEHYDAAYGEIPGLDYVLHPKYNYLTIRSEESTNFYNYYLFNYKEFYNNPPLSIPPHVYSHFNAFENYLYTGITTDQGEELTIPLAVIEEYCNLKISIPTMLKEVKTLLNFFNLLKPLKIIG